MMATPALLIFAKPPHPGQVKTRLIPALGAERAAMLAEALLRHALHAAICAQLGPVRLYTTARETRLARLAREHGVPRRLQRGDDLGLRMADALRRACRHAPAALLLGADCPGLDAAVLRRCAQALQRVDVVFVPAVDGGFVLVGCRAQQVDVMSRVFANQAWSVPDVMLRMRERMRACDLRWTELDALTDVDTPGDLGALPPAMRDAFTCDVCC